MMTTLLIYENSRNLPGFNSINIALILIHHYQNITNFDHDDALQ